MPAEMNNNSEQHSYMRRGFSENAVKQANIRMILGEKPKSHVSDKLSNEDIALAWRKASMRVFGDKANHE